MPVSRELASNLARLGGDPRCVSVHDRLGPFDGDPLRPKVVIEKAFESIVRDLEASRHFRSLIDRDHHHFCKPRVMTQSRGEGVFMLRAESCATKCEASMMETIPTGRAYELLTIMFLQRATDQSTNLRLARCLSRAPYPSTRSAGYRNIDSQVQTYCPNQRMGVRTHVTAMIMSSAAWPKGS